VYFHILLLSLTVPAALLIFGQPAAVTPDYVRAEKFLGYHANPLVLRSGVQANWVAGGGDSFWYRVTVSTPDGRSLCGLIRQRGVALGDSGSLILESPE
jgi:hypothetical protein